MNKIIQQSVKLYFYIRRNGFGKVIKRIKNAVYGKDFSYTAWKRIHHVEDKANKAITERQIVVEDYVLLTAVDICFYTHGQEKIAEVIKKSPEYDIIYADHDLDGEIPFFKPDFNIELLRSSGYIGPMIYVRKKVLDSVENREELINKNRFCELIFACIEKTSKIYHVADILYRISKDADQQYKSMLKSAIVYNLEKYHIDGKIDTNSLAENTYHVIYNIKNRPLISIIIPNKDHMEDLVKCIESIRKQSYTNIEIIIVDNNSTQEKLFEYYKQLEAESASILYWTKPFNYSAINNYGVAHAKGDYYLFLNNDIEFINETDLDEMIGLCQQKENGVVGIKLLYPDGKIQHAGVIIGYGGIAGHAFLGCDGNLNGYMNRINCIQNYSAVTAACMMVKKAAFYQVNGFDESFEVAFNDIDFCLKLGEQGYKIVYTPYACAWHFESKTRGSEDTLKKMCRFNSEVDRFCKRWEYIIKEGDPAYNKNLSLEDWDFRLNN